MGFSSLLVTADSLEHTRFTFLLRRAGIVIKHKRQSRNGCEYRSDKQN